jgi:hypothetical protein
LASDFATSAAKTAKHVPLTQMMNQHAVPQGKCLFSALYIALNQELVANTIPSAICTGTAPATATGEATASASYVPNSYFAFPYAAATFSNEAACTSAVDACEENYDQCVNFLGDGGQYGVTIVVPGGGGTTVEGGGQALGSSSATAVCSSLSSRACGSVNEDKCSDYGNDASSSNTLGLWLVGLSAGVAMLNVMV